MNETIREITSSLWLPGALAAAIALGLGIYLLIRLTTPSKQLAWSIRNIGGIGDRIQSVQGFSLQFDGAPVENVMVAEIVLWNSGREIIDETDFDQDAAFQIRAIVERGASILDIQTIEQNARTANVQATLSGDCMSARITFRALRPEEGAAFQIVHSGRATEAVSVAGALINGTLRQIPGAGSGSSPVQEFANRITVFAGGAALALATVVLLGLESGIVSTDSSVALSSILVIVAIVAVVVESATLVARIIEQRNSPPDSLHRFFETR